MANFCIKDTTFHNKLVQDFEPEFIDVFLSDKIDLNQEYISDEAYNDLYNNLTNNYFRSSQFFDEAREKLFSDTYIKDTLRLFVPENVAERIIQTGRNSKTYTDLLTTYNRILDLKTGYKDSNGNLVLGGGTLFLKNHKDIEDYVLRNKFNTFRKGSLEDFYDILGLNGTNYSFGNIVSDFSSLDVLNSFNRFFNQIVDESDVIEDKLSELYEATGINVKVLDSKDFYKELLNKVNDKSVYNLKNPTKLKRFLETKKAFYYVDENGETFIYFNKDFLSYDTVSHEFMHFVVDVIEREDPELLEELYNYVNTKFENQVKERINIYGEESIYTDESIKKEILVEILTDITNLSTVKNENPNIFKKVFLYIKRFIFHILGLNYNEKRNLSLSLITDDDLFLNNSISKINSILQEKGFITNLYRGLGSHVYFNTVINDHIVSLVNSLKYITHLLNNLKKENTLSLILNINQLLKQSNYEQNTVNDETIVKNSSSLLIDLHNILRTINNIYPVFSVANGIFRLFEINEDLIQRHFPTEYYDEDTRIDKLFEIYNLNINSTDSDFYGSLHGLFMERFGKSLTLVTKNETDDLRKIHFNDEYKDFKYSYKLDYYINILEIIAYYDFVYKLYSFIDIKEDKIIKAFEQEIIHKLNRRFINNANEYLSKVIQKINTLRRELLNVSDVNSQQYTDIQGKITKYTEIKNLIEAEINAFKGLKSINEIKEYVKEQEVFNYIKDSYRNPMVLYESDQTIYSRTPLKKIDDSIEGIVNNLANSVYNYFYFVKSKNEDSDAKEIRNSLYNTFVDAMIELFTGKKSARLYELSNIINDTIIIGKTYKYETNQEQKEALKKINKDWLINTVHETKGYLSVPFILKSVYVRGLDNMMHELNNRVDGFYIGYLSQIFYSATYALSILNTIKDNKAKNNNNTVEPHIYDEVITRLNNIVGEQKYHSYIYFLNILKRFDLISSQYSERTEIDSEKNIKILIIDLLCKFSETGRFDLKFREKDREDLKSFLYYMVLSLLYNHMIASKVIRVNNYDFTKYFQRFLDEFTDRIRKGKTGFIERILKGDFENIEQDLKALKVDIDESIKKVNERYNITYNDRLSFSGLFQTFKSLDRYHRIDSNLLSDYKGFFDFLLQREGIGYFAEAFRQISNNYDTSQFNNHLVDSLNSITTSLKEILDSINDTDLESYLFKIKPFSNTLHEQYLLNKGKNGVLSNLVDWFFYFKNGIGLNPDAPYNAEAMTAMNLSALAQNMAKSVYSFILSGLDGKYGDNANSKTVISSKHAVEVMNTLRFENADVFFSRVLTSKKLSKSKNISRDIELDTVESFVRYIPTRFDETKLEVNVLSLKKITSDGHPSSENKVYIYETISYNLKDILNKFDNPYSFLSQMYEYEISKGMNYLFNYFGKKIDVAGDKLDKIRELFNKEFFKRTDVMNEEEFYMLFIKVVKLLKDNDIKNAIREHLLNHFKNYLNLRKLDSYIGDDFSEVAEKETAIIQDIVDKLSSSNIDINDLTFYLFAYFNEYIKRNNPFKANFNIALNDPANTIINDLYVFNDTSSDANLFKNASRFMGFITSRSNKDKFTEMINDKEFEFIITDSNNNTVTKKVISYGLIAKVDNSSGTLNNTINEFERYYNNFLGVAERFAYRYSDIYRHMLDKNTKIVIKKIISNFIKDKNIYLPYSTKDNKNYVYISGDKYSNFVELERRLLPIFDFNKEAYVMEGGSKISLRQKYYDENKDVIGDFINNNNKLKVLLETLITNKYHRELLNKIKNKIKDIIRDEFINSSAGFGISGEGNVIKHELNVVKTYDHLFHLRKLIDKGKDVDILKYLFFNSRDFNISLIELTKLENNKALNKDGNELKNLKVLMLYMYLLGGSIKSFIVNNIKKEHLIVNKDGVEYKYKIMQRHKETEEIYNIDFKGFNDNTFKEAVIQFLDGIMAFPVLSFGSVLYLINNDFLKEFNTLLNYAQNYKDNVVHLESNNYSEMKMDFIYFQKMISDFSGFIEEFYDHVKNSNESIKIKTNVQNSQNDTNEIPVSDYFMTIIDALSQNIISNEGKSITEEDNITRVFNFQFLVILGNNLFNNTNSDVFYNYRNIIGSNSERDMYNMFTFLFGQFSKSGVMGAFHNIFSYHQRTLTEARAESAHKVGNHPYFGNSEKGKLFTTRVLHDLLNNLFGNKNKRYVDLETYNDGIIKFSNFLTKLNEESRNKRYGLNDVHAYNIDDRLTVLTQEFFNKYLFTDKIRTFKQKYDDFLNSLQQENQQPQTNILSFFSFILKLFKDGKCITENFDDISSSATELSFINSKSGKKGLQYLSRSFVNKDFRNFKRMLYDIVYMSEIDDVVAYELYMLLESFHEDGYKGFIDKIKGDIANKQSGTTGANQGQAPSQTVYVSFIDRYLFFLKNLYEFLESNKNILTVNHVVNNEESRNRFSDYDSNIFSGLETNKNVLYMLLYFNTISEKYYKVTYNTIYIGQSGIEEIEQRTTFRNEFVNFLRNNLKIHDHNIYVNDINRFFKMFLIQPNYKHISPDININTTEGNPKDNIYYHVKRFVKNLKDIDDALTSSLYSQNLPEIAYYFSDEEAYSSVTVNAIRMYFDEIIIKSGNLIFNRDSLQNVFTENLSFDVAFSFVKSAKGEMDLSRYENVLFKSLRNDFFIKYNGKSLFDLLNESGMEDNFYKSYLDIYNDILNRLYVNTTFNVLQSYEDYNIFIRLGEEQNEEYRVPLLPTVRDVLIPKKEDTGEYDENFGIMNVSDEDTSKSLNGKDVKNYTDVFDANNNAKKATNTYTHEDSTNLSYTLLTTLFSPLFKFFRFMSKVLDKKRLANLFNIDFVTDTEEPKTEEIQIVVPKEQDVEPKVIHRGSSTENISFIEKFLTGRINVFVLLHDHVVSSVQKNVIQNLNTFIYKTEKKTVRPLMKRIRTFGNNLFDQLNKRRGKDQLRTLLNVVYVAFLYVIFLITMDSFISVIIFLLVNHLYILLKNLKQTGSVLRSLGSTYRYVFSVVKSSMMLLGYTLSKVVMKSIPGFLFGKSGLKERFYNAVSSLGLPRELGRLYLGEHGTTTSVRSFTLLHSLSELVSMTTFIVTNPIYVKNYLESLASGAAGENAFSNIVISNKGDNVLFFGDIFKTYIYNKQVYIRLKSKYERYLNVLNPDVVEIVRLIENSPKDKKGRNIGIPMLNLYNNKFLSNALISAADTMNVANSYSALKAGIYDTQITYLNIILPFISLATNTISLYLRNIKSFVWSKWFMAYVLGAYGLTVVNSLNPYIIKNKLFNMFSTLSFSADPILSRILDVIPNTATDPFDIVSSIAWSPLNVMVGLLFGTLAYYMKGLFAVKHNPELRTKHCIYDAECTGFMMFIVIGLVLLSYNTFQIINKKEISEHKDNIALTYALREQNLLSGEIVPGVIPLELLSKKEKAGKLLGHELLAGVYDLNSEKINEERVKRLTDYVVFVYDLFENYYNNRNDYVEDYKSKIDFIGSYFLPTNDDLIQYMNPDSYRTFDTYIPLNFRVGIALLFYFEQIIGINEGIIDIAVGNAINDEYVNNLYDAWKNKNKSKYDFDIKTLKNKIRTEAESYVDESLKKIIPDFMNRRNYMLILNRYIETIISEVESKASSIFDYGTENPANFKAEYKSSLTSTTSLMNAYRENIKKYRNELMNELLEKMPFYNRTEVDPDKIIKYLDKSYINLDVIFKKYDNEIKDLKAIQNSEQPDYRKAFDILVKVLPEITNEDKFITYYLNYKSPATIADMFDNFNKDLFSEFSYYDMFFGMKEKTAVSPIIKEKNIGSDKNNQLSTLIDIYAQPRDTAIKESRVAIPMRYKDVVTKQTLYENAVYNILFKNYVKSTKSISVKSDVGEIPALVFKSRRGVFETIDMVYSLIKGFKEPRADETKTEEENKTVEQNQQQK